MAKTDDMEAWVGLPVRLRGEAHQEGLVIRWRLDPPGLLVVLDYSEDLGDPIWFSPDEIDCYCFQGAADVTWEEVLEELVDEAKKTGGCLAPPLEVLADMSCPRWDAADSED